MNRRLIILIASCLVVIFIAVFLLSKNVKRTNIENSGITLNSSIQDRIKEAEALELKGEFIKAQGIYQDFINNSPDSPNIQDIERNLGNLNIKIITSGIATDQTIIYEVKPNDSLSKIAKQLNTTVELVKQSNAINSDVIRVGMQLRIWKGKFSCIVDKSQNILILKSDDKIIKTYKVSTGVNNSTPVGTFHIINKLINPIWYKAGAVVEAGSPENILGTRWMGFELAGYGIHGTTDPTSIGKQVTQGCVRLANPDVEELYMLLPVGTEVVIVD